MRVHLSSFTFFFESDFFSSDTNKVQLHPTIIRKNKSYFFSLFNACIRQCAGEVFALSTCKGVQKKRGKKCIKQGMYRPYLDV